MTRKKRSNIWLLPTDHLQMIVDSSCTVVEVLNKLGFDSYNGNHTTLNRRFRQDNIDTTKMKLNYKRSAKIKKTHNAYTLFVENSNTSRTVIKRHILKFSLIEYQCAVCGNIGVFNDKPLSLQLEHKNGINNDNRLENLCFLCPNCHSQTTTFSGKNKKKTPTEKNYESEIQKNIRIEKMRKFHLEKEELETLIQNHSMVELGKMFGVSDNAIKKRCKRLGIDLSIRKHKKIRN